MVDLLLIAGLGFLGSFGHCLGMCGPITMAFSLSAQRPEQASEQASKQAPEQAPARLSRWQSLRFHLLLNGGRLASYTLVGATIGGLGSVLVAGGQMAGVGSDLRRLMALGTGLLLIWLGLVQVSPGLVPHLPLLHPLRQGQLHDRLNRVMMQFSLANSWWTPLLLGLVWGLIPCGFLYAAQIKAAATVDLWHGALTMLAFGLGTLPMLLGLGLSTSWLSRDRRSQLFQLGGWLTLMIGLLTLMRTGTAMADVAGYSSLGLLLLALIARPISKLWGGPRRYRRLLGVGAFMLGLAHTIQVVQHSWNWQLTAWQFMLVRHQWGVGAGLVALGLLLPLALTSSDWAQRQLGRGWRRLHLLSLPALLAAAVHCLLAGSRFLGQIPSDWAHWSATLALVLGLIGVLAVRSRWVWSLFSLEQYYASPKQP